MVTKLSRKNSSGFQISIGEEGAVVALCNNGVVINKMFVKSTAEQDSAKLKQLLITNPNSHINIYLDTLDQSYLQKSIPSASALGVLKIAKKRLERDIPHNHLKECIQVGRLSTGRKDFLFTFVSAPIEQPLSGWLEYLIPFPNVINGIHFLPIEMHAVIRQINSVAQQVVTKNSDKEQPILKRLFAGFATVASNASKSYWELLITHNKTGGFRQVAYQNGKIVFSRLLNNINHPDPDVLAGNIEQEIANSVEYLTRLSLHSEEIIEIYLVLADEILKNIRADKLKASKVLTFTPHTLCQAAGIVDGAAEKDKFADPAILGCLSKVSKHIVTVYTPLIKKVFKITRVVDAIKKVFDVLIPITLFGSILIFVGLTGARGSLFSTLRSIDAINEEIKTNTAALTAFEQKIEQGMKIDHLLEIYNLYKFLTVQKVNAIEETFLKLGRAQPDFVRAKTIKWTLNDQVLLNGGNLSNKSIPVEAMPPNWNYDVVIGYNFLFIDPGKNIEELQQKYNEFSNALKVVFAGHKMDIAPLPQGMSFEQIDQKVTIGFQAHKEANTANFAGAAIRKIAQPIAPAIPTAADVKSPSMATASNPQAAPLSLELPTASSHAGGPN